MFKACSLLVCSLLVPGFAIVAPSALHAHAYLVKSIPAQRAVLYRAPAKIQLWFNERLESRYSSLTVVDAAGRPVDLSAPEVTQDDPKRLSATIATLRPGGYVIKYRVLSVDGHVVQDQFPFTIKQ